MYGRSTQIFSSDSRNIKVLDVGGGDGERARFEFYPDSEIRVVDLKNGWDVVKYGLPHGPWDVILANHFIEHIEDPDAFLDDCKQVMNAKTILDIGTPNLAAWFNRLLFLFGYVPHSVELSKRYNLGKPFDWNKEPLGGHIRIFTPKTLCQLLKHHGFKILSLKGERSTFPTFPPILWLDGLLTTNVNLASAFRVKCTL